MNREILFRGKCCDFGLWYEGIPVRASNPPYRICAISIPEKRTLVQIIPETCGEYTGLTDKNGKKIFEGDIIKYKDEFLEVRYSDKRARFITVSLNGVYAPYPAVTMAKSKVIGNIHDARAEAEKALKKQKEEE